MNKKLSKVLAAATLASFSVFTSSESLICYVNAAEADKVSYRSNCINLYGDLNEDRLIDTFDLIEMREMVVKNEYSTLADLNRDEKVDGDDLTVLSDYVLGKGVLFDSYFYDDADEDKVCDLFEVAMLKTDPDSDDTDGDTISDYDEIVFSNTSPTNKYTRELSVTDADDDYDDDKLTNAEEIAAGTDATSSDSDSDDVSDYDEIKVHNTNPNDDDTDDDNISDGDELKLGLKPDNDKSDGEVFDYERTFTQSVKSDNVVFSSINTEENEYAVSIDINSAGIAEKSLSIYIGEFANASEDKNIIRKSVGFSYDEKLKVDSAKVYFNLQETEDVEKYMIFEFFPETNYLLPVESKYTENAVYTETTQLGTYCLVKIDDTDSNNSRNGMNKTGVDILASENKIYNDTALLDYELGETEVAFLVDISGSLDEEALEETKRSIHDFSQALFEHSENSYVTIIGYFMNPQSGASKLIQYTDSEEMTILDDIESVESAISNISPCTTVLNNDLNTPVYLVNNLKKDGLFSSDCENKYVFILADSTYTMTNSIGYKVTIPNDTKKSLSYIAENDIQLNYILSKENYIKSKAVNNLKEICNPLGFGVYSKSETGDFSVKSFAKIYSDAIIDLETLPGAYTCSLNFNSIPEMVERNAFINSLPKSYDRTKVPAADADGKINFKDAAVKVGAATLDGNGNLVFPSLYDACDMYDRTRLGFEQYMANKNISDKLISGAVKITPFSDKILYEDSDGDGIINKWDASPNQAIDSNFLYVESTDNYTIDDLYHIRYLKNEERGNDIYKTKENLDGEYFTKSVLYIAGVCAYSDASGLAVQALFNSNLSWGRTPNGANSLLHFLGNSGEQFRMDSPKVPLGVVKNQRKKFYDQMNSLFELAEQTVITGKEYSFITTQNTNDTWFVNFHEGHSSGSTPLMDWWLAVGGGRNGVKTTISCTIDKENIKHYTANIEYFLYDYYDWDEEQEEELANLHKYGIAKYFRQYGNFSFDLNWIQGSRYPAQTHDDRYGNLEIVEFEGIDDHTFLSHCYESAKNYYISAIG